MLLAHGIPEKKLKWFRDKENNTSVFKAKDHLESKKITKAYKELSELELVKRIKMKIISKERIVIKCYNV